MDVFSARLLAEAVLAPLGDRWAHTRTVARRAEQAAAVAPAARDVLVQAAWLHDVGYAPQAADTGFHALDGARFIAQRGASACVVALVAHHSGANVEAEERGLGAQLSALPAPDPVLLDALTFADMTTDPQGQVVTVERRLAEILDRYEEEHPVHRAVSRSVPLLRASVRRTRERMCAVAGQPM